MSHAALDHLKRHALLWIGLGCFAMTVLFVNPFREASIRDDWAYAQMVQHLLATGEYRLNEWAAANMPFQVFFGALFARLLGFSYSTLRISTLTFSFAGLIAFYHLAKEHGFNRTRSGLLTLCLLASPLYLHFSFNFMTDVPFLACEIVALLLYTRAVRLRSYPLMILASVAAAASILTRQFGIAFIPGLLCLWVFSRERRRQAFFYFAGIAIPAIAAAWQLYVGILRPNWTTRGLHHLLFQYYTDPGFMLTNTLWRPIEFVQYLALFLLPLILPAMFAFVADLRKSGLRAIDMKSLRFNTVLLGLLATALLTGAFYERFANQFSLFIPYIEGSLDSFLGLRQHDLKHFLLMLVTLIGGILFARIFLLRYRDGQTWKSLSAGERLLDWVTLFFFSMHVIYFKVSDEYLLVLLPYVLIALGRHLGDWLSRMSIATGIACLVVMAASAAWTRTALERSEAYFSGGEFARSSGISPREIYSSWEWDSSYRFYDYVADPGDSVFPHMKNLDLTGDYFDRWLVEQRAKAQIWVTETHPAPQEKWQILKTFNYRDLFFRNIRVNVVRRWTARADYWFAEHLEQASIEAPGKEYVTASAFSISDTIRPVIFEHPPSRISFNLEMPQRAFLCFGVALDPQTWNPDRSDGVEFQIFVLDESGREKVFWKAIDPGHGIADRKWYDEAIDLSGYAGKRVTLEFVTTPGPNSNNAFDWAGWSNPSLVTDYPELHYDLIK